MWVFGIFLCVSVLAGECRFFRLPWRLWRFSAVLVAMAKSVSGEGVWGLMGTVGGRWMGVWCTSSGGLGIFGRWDLGFLALSEGSECV